MGPKLLLAKRREEEATPLSKARNDSWSGGGFVRRLREREREICVAQG